MSTLKTEGINIRLRPIEREILKKYCKQNQIKQSELIRQIIRQLPVK